MAVTFDKNGDLELNNEEGQRENPKYLSLSNKIVKMTTVTWIVFLVILIVAGIYILLVTTTNSNLKIGESNTESATFGPTPVITSGPTPFITSGPQDTKSINVEIQSCGGIINVDMNRTCQIKFRHVFDNYEGISCTWIIKSDYKTLNLQWSNTDKPEFMQNELLIGELSFADEDKLYCRSIKAQVSTITNIVSTPGILHFTSSFHVTPLNFEVKLIPVIREGTHKNPPQTYYVNKKSAGSLGHISTADSLLGMVTVFENNYKRQLHCSDLMEDKLQCCELVEAYKIDSANGSTSCTKVRLSNRTMQMSSYRTVVVLAPTYGFCQLHWKEAKVDQWEFKMPENVTQVPVTHGPNGTLFNYTMQI